jgi:hypothetical protein
MGEGGSNYFFRHITDSLCSFCKKRPGVHMLDGDAERAAFVTEPVSLRVELITDGWFDGE